MKHLGIALMLLGAFAVSAAVSDTVRYWPATVISGWPLFQKLTIGAVVAIPVVGIAKRQEWGWTFALLVAFWFAMHAGAWAGVIAIRATLDGDPYTMGDWFPHLVAFIALSSALVLLLTPATRRVVGTWNDGRGAAEARAD